MSFEGNAAMELCARCEHEAWRHRFNGVEDNRLHMGSCIYCDCEHFVRAPKLARAGGSYWALRRAVTDALDAEIGDDVVALRRMLTDALEDGNEALTEAEQSRDYFAGRLSDYARRVGRLEEALREVLDYVAGWTRPLSSAERLEGIERVAREALAPARVSPGGGTKQ